MNCFICNTTPPATFFYCQLCQKAEICPNCWKKWLNSNFECPFDKNTTFIYKVTPANKDQILQIEQDPYEFTPIPTLSELPTNIHPKFENLKLERLHNICYFYLPFFNDHFHEKELSYYFHLKSMYRMGIVNLYYDKWVLAIILNEILHNTFIINIEDVSFFGGLNFIKFMNKHFNNSIIVVYDFPTLIHFWDKLWTPKTLPGITVETNIMIYLFDTIQKTKPNLLSLIEEQLPIPYELFKHPGLIEIFAKYYYIKLFKKEATPELLQSSENHPLFHLFFYKTNNQYILIN